MWMVCRETFDMTSPFSKLTVSLCQRLRWLLPLWIFLAPLTCVPAIFAYAAGCQTTVTYDSKDESAIGYDAVSVLATGGKEKATARLRISFVKCASFLAGEGTPSTGIGLESRGLRPAPGTRVRPEGVPDSWKVRPTRGDGGVQYYNPANPNQNLRVMQGNPNSPYPNSQAPVCQTAECQWNLPETGRDAVAVAQGRAKRW